MFQGPRYSLQRLLPYNHYVKAKVLGYMQDLIGYAELEALIDGFYEDEDEITNKKQKKEIEEVKSIFDETHVYDPFLKVFKL
jgi:hypothetical protein